MRDETESKGIIAELVEGACNFVERLMPYKPERSLRTTYADLVAFANKCKEMYPQASVSRVTCEYQPKKRQYQMTQVMLDVSGHVINERNKNIVGRMFYADALDDQITALIGTANPTYFDMPIQG